jgi:hypothetical protein
LSHRRARVASATEPAASIWSKATAAGGSFQIITGWRPPVSFTACGGSSSSSGTRSRPVESDLKAREQRRGTRLTARSATPMVTANELRSQSEAGLNSLEIKTPCSRIAHEARVTARYVAASADRIDLQPVLTQRHFPSPGTTWQHAQGWTGGPCSAPAGRPSPRAVKGIDACGLIIRGRQFTSSDLIGSRPLIWANESHTTRVEGRP